MFLSSWLRPRTSNPGARGPSHRRPAAPRFRPQLESLERRDVPSTLTVTTVADSGAAGDGSLRGEIAAAESGDTIVIAGTLSGQTIALSQGEMVINKSLTITGPGSVYLSGQGYNGLGTRLFEVDGGTTKVTLSGLVLEYGTGLAMPATFSSFGASYDGDGGAILNFGSLTISGCTLSYNTAGFWAGPGNGNNGNGGQ